MGAVRTLAWIFLIAASAVGGRAQTLNLPLSAYEGQQVSAVEFAGRPNLNQAALRPLLVQHAGEPFSVQNVEATITNLVTKGHIPQVRPEIVPEAEGLRIYFILEPALYIGLLEFPGATDKFPYARLLQTANYPNQEPYAESRMRESAAALLKMFHSSGYFFATVQPEPQPDPAHGVTNIIFHVDLRRRAKFGTVSFVGVSPAEAARLRSALHSWHARLHSALIKPGKTYSHKRVQTATGFLHGVLARENYLAGDVHLLPPLYDAETNRAHLIFQITTGPLVTVKTEGAKVSLKTLRKILPIYEENAFDPGLVREGEHDLVSYFQKKGFFDVKVSSETQTQPGGDLVVYHIETGKRYRVENVAVEGNHHLSKDHILSVVTVKKGRFALPFLHGTFSDELLSASAKNIKNLYQNAGFSQVSVTPAVRRDPNVSVTFHIMEGPQDTVAALHVEGNHSVTLNKLAPKGLQLGPGKPYSQHLLLEDRNRIVASYLNLGYLNANLRFSARPLANDPHRLDVTYLISEGPQLRASSVVALGGQQTRQVLLNRAVQVRAGEPVSERQMFQSENQLYDLGVFDWALVSPRSRLTDQSPDESSADEPVLVKLHESKRNTITYGFGFDLINRGGSIPSGTVAIPGLPPIGLPSSFRTNQKTFWGPRGSVEYTRKNIRGLGESLTVGVLGARLDQRASLSYNQPSFWGSSWGTSTTALFERNSENPIFTSRMGSGGVQFRKFLDRKKTMTLFGRYNFQKTVLTNLLIPALILPQDQNIRLSGVSGSFTRDTRDNPLDAHHGLFQSLDMSVNPSAFGSSVNFARLLAQSAVYIPVHGMVWANDIRLGMEAPFSNSHIPISEEFFSGGGSTLRGFPLDSAGPQHIVPVCGNPSVPSSCSQIQVPLGGPQLFIFNSELRFPTHIMKDLGAVVFYDGGNVYAHVNLSDLIKNYSNTIGTGLRYKTPVGPIRVDVGHNLNPIPGLKATQWFVTIGQAF
jgi:outer membrane protein insertion porin family